MNDNTGYFVRVYRGCDGTTKHTLLTVTGYVSEQVASQAIADAKDELTSWLRSALPGNPHAAWGWDRDKYRPEGVERYARGVYGPYTCTVTLYRENQTVPGL